MRAPTNAVSLRLSPSKGTTAVSRVKLETLREVARMAHRLLCEMDNTGELTMATLDAYDQAAAKLKTLPGDLVVGDFVQADQAEVEALWLVSDSAVIARQQLVAATRETSIIQQNVWIRRANASLAEARAWLQVSQEHYPALLSQVRA